MWLKFRSYNVPTENFVKLRSTLIRAGDDYLTEIGLRNIIDPRSPAPIRAIAENIFSNYKDHDCDSAFIMIIKPKEEKHNDYHICQVKKNGIACIKDTLKVLDGKYIQEDTKNAWHIGRFDLFNKFLEIEKRYQSRNSKQMDLIYFEKHTPTFLQASISGVFGVSKKNLIKLRENLH